MYCLIATPGVRCNSSGSDVTVRCNSDATIYGISFDNRNVPDAINDGNDLESKGK